MYVIEFELTIDDHVAGKMDYYRRSRRIRSELIAVWIGASLWSFIGLYKGYVLLRSFFSGTQPLASFNSDLALFFFSGSFFLLVVIGSQPKVIAFFVWLQFQAFRLIDPHLLGKLRMSFSDSCIQISSSEGTSQIPWKRIDRVFVSSSYLFLTMTSNTTTYMTYPIPISAFTPRHQESINRILHFAGSHEVPIFKEDELF